MPDSSKYARYECTTGDSHKFWEIHYTEDLSQKPGFAFRTKYGRIGNKGSFSKEKKFYSIYSRNNEAQKLKQSKLNKGYKCVKEYPSTTVVNLEADNTLKSAPIIKKTPVKKKKKEILKKKEPKKRSAHLSRIKNLEL